MKCKHCNGTGATNWYVNREHLTCPYCGGTGEVEGNMTNDEWRKTCSTEEFAEWITDKINAKLSMALHDAELYPDDINENEYMENEDERLEWLNQPHRKETR